MNFNLKNYILEVSVFICGAVVMVFELIGSRLIGPYVGTSIYAWTSLIGVIMASLSAGYYFGGRLSDKNPKVEILGRIILASAFLISLTVFGRDIGLYLYEIPMSIEVKSIVLSVFLFAPASFFLGMVSPYAVRLKINKMEDIGKDVGFLYALSTFGSIVGTFLAGFYLIPFFGSKTSIFIITIALLITAILLIGRKIYKDYATVIFILFIVIIIIFYFFSYEKKNYFLTADLDTQYNRIWIFGGIDPETKKPIVNLATDPYGTQAAIFADGTNDLVFGYTKFFRISKYFRPDAKKALMIGGSVYTYPVDFINNFKDATMDVVEIDPALTDIAKKYFNFKEDPRINIFHQDARIFLNENKEKYDIIFGDAFNSAASVPFQLTTKEVVQEKFNSLNKDGVVILNIISSLDGNKGKFLRAEYATYKTIFPQVFVFLVQDSEDSSKLQNIVLVASKSKEKFDFKSRDPKINEYLSHIWKGEIKMDMPVLTDDFAPVDYYKRESI